MTPAAIVARDVQEARRDVDQASTYLKSSSTRFDALSKADQNLLVRSRAQIAGVRDHFKLTNAPDPSRRAMLERHFEQAKRHVAMGDNHVTSQRALIAQRERDGHDASESRRLLELFEELQAMHIAHRDRLALQLGTTV